MSTQSPKHSDSGITSYFVSPGSAPRWLLRQGRCVWLGSWGVLTYPGKWWNDILRAAQGTWTVLEGSSSTAREGPGGIK